MLAKQSFSPEALQSVIDHINGHPELLDTDWRELVRSHFYLTEEQEHTLKNLPREKHESIHNHLKNAAAHIRQGGTIAGVLFKRHSQEHTDIGYEIDIEMKPKGSK